MTKQGYTELTLNLLQRSPRAGRLLVRLYEKHQSYATAKDPIPGSRAELTELMVELLGIELSSTEHELITDVLLSLMRQAEVNLKRAIAERLSTMENVPLRMIVHLANEPIIVADPVLRRSRVLNDNDLTYIVKSQSEDHWRAIAMRAQISEELIGILADTQDSETHMNLSRNLNINLGSYATMVLSQAAKRSTTLTEILLQRPDLSEELSATLYEYLGAEVKEALDDINNYSDAPVDTQNVASAIDDVVFDLSFKEESEFEPTIHMIRRAEDMMKRKFLNPNTMVETLRRGKIAEFIGQLSVYCGLPVETVSEILIQSTGQGLAVACKATHIPKTEFINMFLLTSRMRGGAIINQQDLSVALKYYDKITESMARTILNQSRH